MGLTKYRLGKLIEISVERNDKLKYGIDSVKGVSIQKEFIETKADMTGVSLAPYYLVYPDDFVYVTVTSRNGEKITLAHNGTRSTFIVSSSYIVFRVKRTDLILSDYLFMYFNRPEFDRYSRFNSWGSARESFGWEDMCDIEIELPSLTTQQKFVTIYKAMIANQKCYEQGVNDLVLVYESYLDRLRSSERFHRIGDFIELVESKNDSLEYGIESVKGVSIEKKFIDTKADMQGVSLRPYYIVSPNEFAYVPVTSRNGGKISLAINDSSQAYICSSSYIVFRCTDVELLSPQYLMLFFSREEFNRYARFNSWGSARETFDWSEMCDVEIPIPDIETQRAIAEIFSVCIERKKINERLKAQIKDVCPVLIRGSLEYGG